MDKIAVPLQSFGLGDHIFTQNLMEKFIAQGYKIIYPVENQFVEGLNRAYPSVHFIPKDSMKIDWNNKRDYIKDGIRYLPIRFADQILGRPYKDCMRAKYDLYDYNWTDWKQTMYLRNPDIELELFNKVVPGSEYILESNFFGSNSQFQAETQINSDLPIVKLEKLENFSLFDWSMVIENASYIHAASSSILYLLELLDLKAKEVHLYARKPIEPHFNNVEYLFTKNYILHV